MHGDLSHSQTRLLEHQASSQETTCSRYQGHLLVWAPWLTLDSTWSSPMEFQLAILFLAVCSLKTSPFRNALQGGALWASALLIRPWSPSQVSSHWGRLVRSTRVSTGCSRCLLHLLRIRCSAIRYAGPLQLLVSLLRQLKCWSGSSRFPRLARTNFSVSWSSIGAESCSRLSGSVVGLTFADHSKSRPSEKLIPRQ